jgi:hypothetical protein
MVRAATLILITGLFVAACAAPTPEPSSTNRVLALPSRTDLRMAFEKLGVKFLSVTHLGGTYLLSANSNYSGTDRAFVGVEIDGDPAKQVIVTLSAFTVDSSGRFPGSALIDVMDSFDPGVKRWFVAQESDPRLAGLAQELHSNGLVAQIPPSHTAVDDLVIKTPPVPTAGSN